MAAEMGDGAPDPDVVETFDVHALPVGRVVDFEDEDRDGGTVGEAARVLAALGRIGGRAAVSVLEGPAVQSLTEADEALANWAGEREETDHRPSVLLWFGHGTTDVMGPTLLVPGSKEREGNARVSPQMFARHIHTELTYREPEADDHSWAIVVVEACGAMGFLQLVEAEFQGPARPDPRALLLIGSGKPAAQGYLGAFRAALDEYLLTVSAHDQVFTLQDLARHLDSPGCWTSALGFRRNRELALRLRDTLPLTAVTTVADHQRMQDLFDGEEGRLPRFLASGYDRGFGELAWGFTGRGNDLRAVAEWFATPEGSPVLAVTGPPGVGKSAFLGQIVLLAAGGAGPELDGAGFTDESEAVNDLRFPGIVAVLRLTGSTTADVLRQLAERLPGEDSPEADGDPLQRMRERLGRLGGCADSAASPARPLVPAVILADSLDEARDPALVASLLQELTDGSGVRLVIGTRRSAQDPGEPDGTDRTDLLETLGASTGRTSVLTLQAEPAAARAYTENGIRDILVAQRRGDGDWHDAVVRKVASAVERFVADGSWKFLQVSLVVQEIRQRPELLEPDGQHPGELDELLAHDQGGLFRAAVTRIVQDLPAADVLLRALAHGLGRGLPRADGIWAQAAAGLAGNQTPPDEQGISLFLSRAAAYVLLDGEDRRSVYSLSHRTHAGYLLRDEAPDSGFAMFSSLLRLAASQAEAGDSLSPHLATRLADYAADCGERGWTALAEQRAVVDRLPLVSLSAQVLARRLGNGATPADLPIEVLGTVSSAHLIEESAQDDRPGLRQLGGLRAAGVLHEAGPGAAWEVCWGRLRRVPLHLQLGGVGSEVSALAAGSASAWLVTGTLDGTAVVWRPWREHRPRMVLRGPHSAVTAVAAMGSYGTAAEERTASGQDDGPGILAVAHDDRTLHLWNTDAAHPAPVATTSTETVTVMAALPDGTRRFAVAGLQGYLMLLGSGGERSLAAQPFNTSPVVGLAPVTGEGGEQLLVTAHRSGQLGLWDVTGRAPFLVDRRIVQPSLSALTSVVDQSGAVRLVTAALDGRVANWRLGVRRGGNVLVPDGEEDPSWVMEGTNPVLAALPVPEGGMVPVLGDGRGMLRVVASWNGPGRLVYAEGSAGITGMIVVQGPHGGGVLVTSAWRDVCVHFTDPMPSEGAVTVQPDAGGAVTDIRRYVSSDGTEMLVATERVGDSTVHRVLSAVSGEEMPVTVQRELSNPGRPEGSWEDFGGSMPATADDLHDGRVVDSVALMGLSAPPSGTGMTATAGSEGTVVLWQVTVAGGARPVRRIRLGSRCLRLAALSHGRLAVATDDGIVVLRIEPPGSGRHTEGWEHTRG